MKIQKKLLIRFLTIFILWTAGMNVCMAQSSCNCDAGELCFTEEMDPDGNFTTISPPLCLSPSPLIPGKSYCVFGDGTMGVILNPEPLGGCTAGGGQTWYASALPLSDASFLLIFLLGVYGFSIYIRKKKYRTV